MNLDGSLINGYSPTDATGQWRDRPVPAAQRQHVLPYRLLPAASTCTFANQLAQDPRLVGYNTIKFNGVEFAISYTASAANGTFTGGHDVALMAVPEPNIFALFTAAIGLQFGIRRFRRRRTLE